MNLSATTVEWNIYWPYIPMGLHCAACQALICNMESNLTFREDIFGKKRWLVWVACAMVVLQFVLLKCLFPHAIIVPDSQQYIYAAVRDLGVNVWPVGYSKLLSFLHFFTHSDNAIVVIQYFLAEFSILYFYFTLLYLLQPGKLIACLPLLLLVLNPFIVGMTNYILSDSLFMSLTLLWLTSTIWYLRRPGLFHLYAMIMLLFLAFTIRYYAIFYPLITGWVILVSKIQLRHKLLGFALGLVLFLVFIAYNNHQYKRLIGRSEFTAFSGWQLAGNAMIMYRNMAEAYDTDRPLAYLQPLHQLVIRKFREMSQMRERPDSALFIYYMWLEGSPLRRYMRLVSQNDNTSSEIKKWAEMGTLYKDYALFLIKRHPIGYLQYYIKEGLYWYASPTVEFANEFPEGRYPVSKEVQDWYGFKSTEISCSTSNVFSFNWCQTLLSISNGLMLLAMIGYFTLGCHKRETKIALAIIHLCGAYWVINFFFIVITAPMVLRYGLVILVVNIAIGLTLADWIYRSEKAA